MLSESSEVGHSRLMCHLGQLLTQRLGAKAPHGGGGQQVDTGCGCGCSAGAAEVDGVQVESPRGRLAYPQRHP
jgi:hypothetical protein